MSSSREKQGNDIRIDREDTKKCIRWVDSTSEKSLKNKFVLPDPEGP